MTIRGVIGRLEWGYFTAAAIHGYAVTGETADAQTWSLQATVIDSDRFKLTQRPLEFVALTKHFAWVWTVEAFTLVDGRLQARLGPRREQQDGLVVRAG